MRSAVDAQAPLERGMSRFDLFALEVNAVLHCNLCCVGCSHASPVSEKAFSDPDQVGRDMAALASAVTVEQLRVLGGEPLLHPQLPELLRAIRGSGISGRIGVITNGTRLHLTSWEWLMHTDEVYVSCYPGANVRPEALAELEHRCRRLRKELVVRHYHSFRLVHPARPLGSAEAAAVFDTCQLAHSGSCHTVHAGHLYLCPPSAPPAVAAPDERCALTPVQGLRERLERFLARRQPLSACRECLGSVGVRIPHEQANALTWLKRSHRGEIDHDHLRAIRANQWEDPGCSDRELVIRGKRHPLTGWRWGWRRKVSRKVVKMRAGSSRLGTRS